MRKKDEPVVVEQTVEASIETVWDAITRIEQMHQWFFKNIPSFKPEKGFKTRFNVRSQGRNFLHLWEVIEVEPPKKIVINWKYQGYPGDSIVLFELFNENNLTTLRLTAVVTESFPKDIPEFRRESCLSGWTFFIKKNLKTFLENNKKPSSSRR